MRRMFVFLLLFMTIVLSEASFGMDKYYTFNFKQMFFYSDNAAFTAHNKKDDFYSVTGGALFWNALSETTSFFVKGGLDAYKYIKNENLDDVYHDFRVDFDRMFGEKFMLSFVGFAIQDTTLDHDIEGGTVRKLEDRRRYKINPSFSYDVTERLRISSGFQWFRTEYDFPWYVDYNDTQVTFTLDYALSERNTLSWTSYYEYTSSPASKLDGYGTLVGFKREVTERFKVTALGGIRYTDIDYWIPYYTPRRIAFYPEKHHDGDWSVLVDLFLDYQLDPGRAKGGVLRHVVYSTYGEPVEVIKIYGSYYRRATRRFSWYIEGNYYNEKSKERIRKEDSDHFDGVFMFTYRITDEKRVGAAYRYTYYKDKYVDRTYERNQVWVFLTIEFGKPRAELPDVLAH